MKPSKQLATRRKQLHAGAEAFFPPVPIENG